MHMFMQNTTSTYLMGGKAKELKSLTMFWKHFYLKKNVLIVLKTIE